MEKEKKKKSGKALYILGSLAITAVAVYVVPKFINEYSNYVYKKMPSSFSNNNEWGEDPVKITKQLGG